MTVNKSFFEGPAAYLRARGFDDRGNRSGGILAPKVVEVPPGAILFRFFHRTDRKFGEWWSTAHELASVLDHFAREGPALAAGRSEGKGVLHAAYAVRHDWSKDGAVPGSEASTDHLGRFICGRTLTSLSAYYGDGDDAPSADKTSVQKAVRILGKGGSQVRVRQLFFPSCCKYQDKFGLYIEDGCTDTELLNAVRKYQSGPLAFE